jgi:pyruvate dehydrogenase E1 component
MVDLARRRGATIPFSSNTAYVNTIPAHLEAHCPGNLRRAPAFVDALERDGDGGQGQPRRRRPRRPYLVVRLAGQYAGHRLQPFLACADRNHGGDLLYIQGHSSPGIYARAFLEGRLTEEQLLNFRQEVDGKGMSRRTRIPWLMPDFWQFPTVSMGLGPLMAIYQARFLKYLHGRGLIAEDRPQGLGLHGRRRDGRARIAGRDLAGRPRRLDNLVFVINCNLQRLDGPVRGNGKIIQELEGVFRGAGWNVIKVSGAAAGTCCWRKDTSGKLCSA